MEETVSMEINKMEEIKKAVMENLDKTQSKVKARLSSSKKVEFTFDDLVLCQNVQSET